MDDKRARFDSEVLAHLDAAHRFARWLCRSPADADDIVQDAVLRAYRAFEDLHGSDPKAWLFAIVRNCFATAAARQQRRAQVPLPEEHDPDGHVLVSTAPDPEHASIQRDHARLLDRLLSTLPAEQREVLILREMEDMSYRAIAAVTREPIGTVMSRLARARAALRTRWLQESQEPQHALR